MIDLGPLADRIIASREIPPRPARYGEFPQGLLPELRRAVQDAGIEKLFAHQAEMVRRALAGENVVITTGTASGKTLAFLLPIVQRVIERPETRAILLYPTKALAQDQLRGILELAAPLGRSRVQAGVYDGDTPPDERRRIREQCNLVLTNPDMLNAAWLPNHGRRGFSHVFRNVAFLVLDELHTYRGAFGAHMANLMRRFRRICRHYGSDPAVLASSATIANPIELARTICDRPFSLVEDDGSPSAGKTVHFWQPPVVENDFRRGVVQEMAELMPLLVNRRVRSIAFCRSRKETEIVLKESRDALAAVDGGHDESALIAGYRAGYTPEERRAVERDLVRGDLIGVVSTNALELGIDVGALEVVVQGGFPGTRASFWQQIGRAGRRNRRAEAFVMLRMAPIDQYVGLDPDWLMGRSAEHAVVDPDNLMIQLAHIRAAAAELPLTIDDAGIFPDLGEAAPILLEAGELEPVYGAFHWRGDAHPAGDFSLRNIDGDRFKVVNRETGSTLTEMDRPQTYREAHPRAVYLHDGLQYLVEKLDLIGHQVLVRPVEQNFYTEPDVRTTIEVLNVQERRTVSRSRAWFGDVRVEDATVGYKMLQFHNHQNLGYEILPQRLAIQLETEGAWIELPPEVLQVLAAEGEDHVKGVIHALLNQARMTTMAEGSDLGGTSFHFSDENGRTLTAVILHDRHPGGLGFSSKAFERLDEVVEGALALVSRCPCRNGCPACVGDYALDRGLVRWALESIETETEPPSGRKAPPPRARTTRIDHAFRWNDLARSWEAFTRSLPAGEAGADWLRTVRDVRVLADTLVLEVDSPGAARWVNEGDLARQLAHLVAHRVAVPAGFRVEARVRDGARDDAARRSGKLRRRLEDLKNGASAEDVD